MYNLLNFILAALFFCPTMNLNVYPLFSGTPLHQSFIPHILYNEVQRITLISLNWSKTKLQFYQIPSLIKNSVEGSFGINGNSTKILQGIFQANFKHI